MYHQEEARDQVNRVFEDLLFILVRRCQLLAYDVFDLGSGAVSLKLSSNFHNVCMRPDCNIPSTIVKCMTTFLQVKTPVRRQITIEAAYLLELF